MEINRLQNVETQNLLFWPIIIDKKWSQTFIAKSSPSSPLYIYNWWFHFITLPLLIWGWKSEVVNNYVNKNSGEESNF